MITYYLLTNITHNQQLSTAVSARVLHTSNAWEISAEQ